MEQLNQTQTLLNIVLTLVTIISILFSIAQYLQKRKEVEILQNLLTSYHNFTEGLRNSLFNIGQNPNNFTDKKDVVSAVNVVSQIAAGISQAMEEQRFYTPEEIKSKREDKQKKFAEEMRKFSEMSQPVDTSKQ